MVITIVVLLILASVTIATLTGENGIITKAGEASEKTKIAGYKESIQLSVQYLVMDGSIFGDEDYPEKLEEEMQNYSNLEGAYAERVDSGDVEVTTEDGYVFWVSEDGIDYAGTTDKVSPRPPKGWEQGKTEEGDDAYTTDPKDPGNEDKWVDPNAPENQDTPTYPVFQKEVKAHRYIYQNKSIADATGYMYRTKDESTIQPATINLGTDEETSEINGHTNVTPYKWVTDLSILETMKSADEIVGVNPNGEAELTNDETYYMVYKYEDTFKYLDSNGDEQQGTQEGYIGSDGTEHSTERTELPSPETSKPEGWEVQKGDGKETDEDTDPSQPGVQGGTGIPEGKEVWTTNPEDPSDKESWIDPSDPNTKLDPDQPISPVYKKEVTATRHMYGASGERTDTKTGYKYSSAKKGVEKPAKINLGTDDQTTKIGEYDVTPYKWVLDLSTVTSLTNIEELEGTNPNEEVEQTADTEDYYMVYKYTRNVKYIDPSTGSEKDGKEEGVIGSDGETKKEDGENKLPDPNTNKPDGWEVEKGTGKDTQPDEPGIQGGGNGVETGKDVWTTDPDHPDDQSKWVDPSDPDTKLPEDTTISPVYKLKVVAHTYTYENQKKDIEGYKYRSAKEGTEKPAKINLGTDEITSEIKGHKVSPLKWVEDLNILQTMINEEDIEGIEPNGTVEQTEAEKDYFMIYKYTENFKYVDPSDGQEKDGTREGYIGSNGETNKENEENKLPNPDTNKPEGGWEVEKGTGKDTEPDQPGIQGGGNGVETGKDVWTTDPDHPEDKDKWVDPTDPDTQLPTDKPISPVYSKTVSIIYNKNDEYGEKEQNMPEKQSQEIYTSAKQGVVVKKASMTIAESTPTREKYDFIEWNDKKELNGTKYNPKQEVQLDADLNLYAVWEITDDQIPTVEFNPSEWTESYKKELLVNIKIRDNKGVDENNIRYLWKQEESEPITKPEKNEFTTSGTELSHAATIDAGETIAKTGVSGDNWYLWVLATDIYENVAIEKAGPYHLDAQGPTITITPTTDSTTFAKSQSAKVKINDANGLNPDGLKYRWLQESDDNQIHEAEINIEPKMLEKNQVESIDGQTVTLEHASGSGYYLWVMAKDTAGNLTIEKSGPYNLDNSPPTVEQNTEPEEPKIDIKTNAITITVNTAKDTPAKPDGSDGIEGEDNSGIDKYYYSVNDGVDYYPQDGTTSNTFTFNDETYPTGIKENTPYNIKVKVVDKAGNEFETETQKKTTKQVESLQQADIQFKVEPQNPYNDTGYTNDSVKVTMKIKEESQEKFADYHIEYTTDNPSESPTWEKGSSNTEAEVTVQENGPVYARVADSSGQSNATASMDIQKIDKLEPNDITDIQLSANTNSISVSVTAEDQTDPTGKNYASGIAEYYFALNKHDSPDDWKTNDEAPSTPGYNFNELKAGQTYTIYVKTVDNAGNESKIAENSIQVKPMPSAEDNISISYKIQEEPWDNQTWTDKEVTVEIADTREENEDKIPYLIIEYATKENPEDSDYQEYLQPFTIKENTVISARFKEKLREDLIPQSSEPKTEKVTHIDNKNPNDPGKENITTEKTTKSITVTVPEVEDPKDSLGISSGVEGYYFRDGAGEWLSNEDKKNRTYKFDNLQQGSQHTIQVRILDNTGNETITELDPITLNTMPQITSENVKDNIGFSYTPSDEYTYGPVTITLTKKNEQLNDYTIQYSYTDQSDYEDYPQDGITDVVTNKKTVYARLTDGYNATTGVMVGSVTNIDRASPQAFTIEASATTNTVTVTLPTEVQDAPASDDYASSGNIKYYYSINNGTNWYPQDGTTSRSFTFGSSQTDSENSKKETIVQGQTYNQIRVKAEDKVKNATQSTNIESVIADKVPGLTNATIHFHMVPIDKFTQGPVTMTMDIDESVQNKDNYILQYAKENPGQENSWKEYKPETEPIQYFKNGTLYARLVDSSNQHADSMAQFIITTIDKLPPLAFTPTAGDIQSISIKVSGTTTDDTSNATDYTNSQPENLKYQFNCSKDPDKWLPESPSTTNYYTFPNLSPGTEYTFSARAYDEAGNMYQTDEDHQLKQSTLAQVALNISVDPPDTGTIKINDSDTTSANIIPGTSTSVTATPATGYDFVGWYEGDVQKNEGTTYTFEMPGTPLNLTAKFKVKTLNVTYHQNKSDSSASKAFTVEYR